MKTMTMARRKRTQVNFSEATARRARLRTDSADLLAEEGRVGLTPPGAAMVDMLVGLLGKQRLNQPACHDSQNLRKESRT